ncbi:BTAD domain-containing putative transcriptional regulator [Pilimelia terevasa]|uniref:BTAD domain-containing putative transcriptional regulator n=1 Tax=Pilimelia terevasa TaxID=53372 RepID=UPI0016630081|nr:BTAD domain-containing putative transcriptional regulator [Pilimelia terevasa]
MTVLGRLSVAGPDGQVVPTDGLPRRARQVLCVLAARHDRPQSKDALADAVWGEELPGNHVAALEHYISLIRRTLQPGRPTAESFIVTRAGGYLFATARADLDLAELRTAVRGADEHAAGTPGRLALRQRILDLAEDLPFGDDEYAEWADGPRAEVRQALLLALCELAGDAVEVDPARALRLAGEAVALDRFAETPYRLAMRAAAGLGRTDDALRWYDRCQQALDEELGVPPSVETAHLRAEIVARRGQGPAARPARPAAAPPRLFLGRRTELELLLADSAPAVVHLVGPIGAGKSALLSELVRRAPERVGLGRGPGAGATDTLRLTWLRSALEGLGAASTARAAVEAAMGAQRGLSVAELTAVADALRAVDRPVLAVDDATDLDADSVTELGWLRDHCPGLRLALAYPYPSALAGRPLANLGADLVLRLEPLTQAELAPVDGGWTATGGVPALVGVVDAPTPVAASVAMHVARVRARALPPSAWEILRLCATVGPLAVGEVRELTALALPEVLSGVDQLVHAHLLTEDLDGRVALRAELIRAAIDAQVSAAHRAHLVERRDAVRARAAGGPVPEARTPVPSRRRRSTPTERWNTNSRR